MSNLPDVETAAVEDVLTGIAQLVKHIEADRDNIGNHLRVDGVKITAVIDALASKSFDPRSVQLFEQASSELSASAKAVVTGLDQVIATLKDTERQIGTHYAPILSTSVGSRPERAA